MAKFIHSMIRILDESASVDFYRSCFDLKIAERLDFEKFTLIYLANEESETELELTVNKGRTEPYNLGDGYGHVAFSVEDVDALHAKLKTEGYAPRDLVDFAPAGEVIARFFFIADPDGYQIEVMQRSGRYK